MLTATDNSDNSVRVFTQVPPSAVLPLEKSSILNLRSLTTYTAKDDEATGFPIPSLDRFLTT